MAARCLDARFPVASRVKVIDADSEETEHRIGMKGVVVGYGLGNYGDWPYPRVRLEDGTIDLFAGDGDRDDEIVRDYRES